MSKTATPEPGTQEPQDTLEASAMLASVEQEYVKDIDDKLEADKPAYERYLALKGLRDRITGVVTPNGSAPAPVARKRSGSGTRQTGTTQAQGGERAEQFVKIVRENPEGLTMTEIAAKMGLNSATYLYRVAPPLVETGVVRKEGSQFFPPAA